MEEDDEYRAEEYYEGDWGLGYVHLPDVDDVPALRPPPTGRPRGASTTNMTD